MEPWKINAKGSKDTTTSWDANTEIGLSAVSKFVDVYCTTDTYLLVDNATTDPATTGAIYPGGNTHRVPTAGHLFLHYKGVTNGRIDVTEFAG